MEKHNSYYIGKSILVVGLAGVSVAAVVLGHEYAGVVWGALAFLVLIS